MSDELSAIVRAAAREEAAAAEREFPYSSATLGRFVGDVRRRRAVGMALLALVAVAAVGGAALGLGRLWQTAPTAVFPLPTTTSSASPDRSATPTPTAEPSTAPSPSPSQTPSPSATPTPTKPSPHPTSAPSPSKPPTVAVPGPVTVITAGAGGGSGEVQVWWDPVPGATGYRVYRSDSPDGPFTKSASYDVATGKTTIEYVLSSEYIVIEPSWPQGFEYIEVISEGPTYFQVKALNVGGEGPPSAVVCGTPPGNPAC
jgi:hypothetical protein